MSKLTTECLEKFVNDIKTDGMCDITDHQVESALIQLLAYEQAADRPVGEIFRCSGNKTLRWWNDVPEGTVLYAAPVLPKQPEHSRQHFESLCNQFWNWAEFDEINQDEEPRLEWNGSNYTHRVTAALWKMYQAAPAQPVIPEQRQMVPDERPADSSNGNDAEAWFDEGWNACRAEILKAQPVSKPYKLPDGWVMVPQEATMDMLKAGAKQAMKWEAFQYVWSAMLAAAPAQESE